MAVQKQWKIRVVEVITVGDPVGQDSRVLILEDVGFGFLWGHGMPAFHAGVGPEAAQRPC